MDVVDLGGDAISSSLASNVNAETFPCLRARSRVLDAAVLGRDMRTDKKSGRRPSDEGEKGKENERREREKIRRKGE